MKTSLISKRNINLFLILIILISLTVSIKAQQTLSDADWFEREIGSGVIWRYYLFDNLFGSKQTISYIDADLNNPNVSIEFPYLTTGRQLTSTMIPSQFPDSVAGINGTYFDTSVGGHRTYLRINGSEIPPGGALFSPWGYEGAIAMNSSNTESVIKIPTGGWKNDVTHPDIMACGPLLIIGGVIPSDDLTAIGAHCTGRNPRSAVGITANNHLILLAADGRTELADGMTCEETAIVMEQLGCPNALNLDGGGSTTLYGKGELYNGVLNYPSDNGEYDHKGERACSNAIAVISTAPKTKGYDARLKTKTYSSIMECNSQQTVTLVYDNIGTSTWTVADTKLVLARPETRTSPFYNKARWQSVSQPALMKPEIVLPNESATFTFLLQSPDVPSTTVFDEHFMLTQAGIGRIGPADSEAWMRIVVQPELVGGQTFIV
ncbi:MAG: phosphodiester glycosidase family protein, partial [Prolixibacteraceae bacterium]|nr:phosphodiester glycosidase family protein [Prolixibacteraceae bacterium]